MSDQAVDKPAQAESEKQKVNPEVVALLEILNPKDILKGYITHTFKSLLGEGVDVIFRSLTPKQSRAIARDLRRYRTGRTVEGMEAFLEGEIPEAEENFSYQSLRELAETVVSLSDDQIHTMPLKERIGYFDGISGELVNVLHRTQQIFLTAVTLLFATDDVKRRLDLLKK